MNDQAENLGRVRGRIAGSVLRFVASRLALGAPRFRMGELQSYVAGEIQSAPASPDRILRQLRREGLVDYRVIDRAGSLYEALPVAPKGDAQ